MASLMLPNIYMPQGWIWMPSFGSKIYMPNSSARLIRQLVFPPCLSYNHSCAQCYILADYVDSRQRFGVSTLDRSRGLAERSRRWQAKGAVWNFRFPGRCFIHKCTKTLYSNGFHWEKNNKHFQRALRTWNTMLYNTQYCLYAYGLSSGYCTIFTSSVVL